ncbi:NAD-dependent epimerase/dehydratase family protein [Aquabacterium sp.]|uniref:NAD-dependent epimerase/dehydratase family protein n=1 Tax=Aquabacterium sp. TaxID=1872578 RepID=UPI002BC5124F|nr:NAD(P)-dependent oxidoreductase [Aquabacterium sp.]HSW05653.1 NAD(P)-dependent oxidoreductase [Aquabacterium sp.]
MILVTGATSGLGRNAVDDLLQRGIRFRATGRDPARLADLRERGVDAVCTELSTLDAPQARALLRDVHTVWHCAALSSPWGPAAAFEAANVTATRRLAEAAMALHVPRFVHISTPSIYFDYRSHHDIDESYRAARPVNAYAASKLRAERYLRGLARRSTGTQFVMLRPRALFGPHDRVLLPRLLALLRARRGVLPLPDGGRATMDLTYVGNVVQAMHLAGTRQGLPNGAAYNITNQQPTTLPELLQALLVNELGLQCEVRAVPYRLMDAAARVAEAWGHVSRREPPFTRYGIGALQFEMTLSARRARDELGYYPTIDLQQGILQTARWLKHRGQDQRL